MKEVNLPDGSVGRFPDEMSDDAIAEVLRKQFPPTAPVEATPVPAPAPTWAQTMDADYAPPASVGEALLYAPGRLMGMPPSVQRGMMKGAASTAQGLGRMVASGFGRGELNPEQQAAFSPDTFGLEAVGAGEKIGKGAEQVGEFVGLPGPAKATGLARLAGMGKQAIAAAMLAKAQGASNTGVGVTAALAAVPGAPIARALDRVSRAAVRSVVKPTVGAIRKMAGRGGVDAKANQIINFMVDNKITTPEKATAIIQQAEEELKNVVGATITDAPQRALRYLKTLAESAKEGLRPDAAAAMKREAEELLKTRMGVAKLSPELKIIREPRTDVSAAEALTSARASSKWSTGGQWGPKDRAEALSTVAAKAKERGLRDAVKVAVPAAKPILKRESQAIMARDILEMAKFRQNNANAIPLESWVAISAETAAGKPPVLGVLAALWKNKKMSLGIKGASVAKALESGNAQQAAFILRKAGISVPPSFLKAQPPESEEE